MSNLTFNTNKTSNDEVAKAWTAEYLPTVKAEHLQPLLAKLEIEKAQYLNTYCDILQLVKSVETQRERVSTSLEGWAMKGWSIPRLVNDGVAYSKGVIKPVDLDNLQETALLPNVIKRTCEAFGIERVSGWEA